jgi:hypothetical protein
MGNESTSLRGFLDLVESRLDVTEPAVLEDCSVASIGPVQGGLVGLDVDTGRPMRIGWRYKTIEEKPVIINAGAKQTVIPPAAPAAVHPLIPLPAPVKLPAPAKALPEGAAAAHALYDAMKARYQPAEHETAADAKARQVFVAGCLAQPEFYAKWRDRLDALERGKAEAARQRAEAERQRPVVRQRIVDT